MGILGERGWGAIAEPALFRHTLSLIAVAAAAWLLFIVACITSRYAKYGWFGGPSEKAGLWFGTTTLFVMASPLLLVGFCQERYLIPLVPFALVALTAACKGLNVQTCTRQLVACDYPLSFGTVAVFYAHDFLV